MFLGFTFTKKKISNNHKLLCHNNLLLFSFFLVEGIYHTPFLWEVGEDPATINQDHLFHLLVTTNKASSN